MATIKTYVVKRAGFARNKNTGARVHISRHNEGDIPRLLTKADIKLRVESGAFDETDTGIEESDLEAARELSAEAGVKVEPEDTAATPRNARARAGRSREG